MIKFQEGELLDLLPSSLKNDADMICLSYALKMAVRRLLVYERSAMTQNFVDSLPEKILDVLAVELRSPYYLDSMEIGVKREIIKNTLIWHTKAGTASAVSEMIGIVFGEGSVVEWPDFDEPPYTPGTFDIVTNTQMTEDITEFFMAVIEKVKNERSHIRKVLIHREMEMNEYAGAGLHQIYKPAAVIDGAAEKSRTIKQELHGGFGLRRQYRPSAIMEGTVAARAGKQYKS